MPSPAQGRPRGAMAVKAGVSTPPPPFSEKEEKNTEPIQRRSGPQKLREAYTPTKLRSRSGWSYTVLPPQKAA